MVVDLLVVDDGYTPRFSGEAVRGARLVWPLTPLVRRLT